MKIIKERVWWNDKDDVDTLPPHPSPKNRDKQGWKKK